MSTPNSASSFQSNRLLLAATLALCAGGVWLAAFILLKPPAAGTLPDYYALVAYDPDRRGGHLVPDIDQDVQGERSGNAVHWHTDSSGFRIDAELAAAPLPGVERLFLLGDSFVDGMRTDQTQTIGALLEKDLKAAGSRVEVVISGHNNAANAWYWVQTHSAGFSPKRVVLGLTVGNDFFAQNLYAGMTPDAQPGRVKLVDRGMMDGDLRRMPERLPATAFIPVSPARDAWTAREFALRSWLAERTGWFADSVAPVSGSNRPYAVWDRDIYASIGLFHVPHNGFAEFSMQSVDTTLSGIATLLKARGVAFTVVIFPVRHQVNPRDWRLLARSLALNPSQFDLDQPNKRVLATCTTEQIHCIDPSAAMRAHYAQGGAALYRPRGDMHFNEAGNRLVAALIAQDLRHSD